MTLDVVFEEQENDFEVGFEQINEISDGGYERGYAAGYETGATEGYTKGHADGLAARTYETWTITLTDGSVIEKDVALL